MISYNQNELEVLRILWERGESKPADIQLHFAWPIENGTLRSVLVKLLEEGHVSRELQGKAFYYTPVLPKATLLQTMMQTVTRVFARGSHRELVAQLVETGDIKPNDLKLLHEIAEEEPATTRTQRKEN